MSEEQIEQAKILAGLRNAFQEAIENIDAYLNWLGQKQGFRDQKKPKQASIGENVFQALKWEAGKGSRLGDFEVAYKTQNMPDPWQHAYNILKANNSLIANAFKEEGYAYRYWIFPEKYTDRIFRQRLSESEVKAADRGKAMS